MNFQFRPVLTIFTVFGLIFLVGLGAWQLQRRAWKLDLIEKIETRTDAPPISFDAANQRWKDAGDTEYLPVVLKGAFRHELEAHVFGTLNGAPGYYVFTPVELAQGDSRDATFIYVNRGFVPQAHKDADTRREGLVSGPVEVRGLFRAPEQGSGLMKTFRPHDSPGKNQWFRREPAAFGRSAGILTAAAYVDSFGAENPGQWPKGGTTRLDFRNKHLEYALTWFGLAAALLAVWLAYSRHRD